MIDLPLILERLIVQHQSKWCSYNDHNIVLLTESCRVVVIFGKILLLGKDILNASILVKHASVGRSC